MNRALFRIETDRNTWQIFFTYTFFHFFFVFSLVEGQHYRETDVGYIECVWLCVRCDYVKLRCVCTVR